MIFFYPTTIETCTSKINGRVKIIKFFGSYSLIAGKFTQSGGLVHAIWKKVLLDVSRENTVKNPKILILGLGAGSAAQVAHNLWPTAQITGIEIDPVIIKLAKKYFKINTISKLNIINKDAIRWTVNNAKDNKGKFNLILVDLYIGGKSPPESRQIPFLKAVNQLLCQDGLALFNRLVKAGESKNTESFVRKLTKIFSRVQRLPSPANKVYAGFKK